jgi:hypothetical protein
VLAAAGETARGENATDASPVTAHLDHVMFQTPGRRQLTALLVDTLGLPLVWPQPGSSWTGSTGVGFGNTTLEIGGRDSTVQARLSSLAFQATDFQRLPEALDRRGVPHGDSVPGPVAPERPNDGPRWQIIGLLGMGRGVFFIQYAFAMNERRDRFRRQLEAAHGGALGVRRVREVIAGVNAPDSTVGLWRRLFGGHASPGDATWRVSDLSVHVVPNTDPARDSFIVEVRSLDVAEGALRSLGIPATRQGSALFIEPARLWGLRLILVE